MLGAGKSASGKQLYARVAQCLEQWHTIGDIVLHEWMWCMAMGAVELGVDSPLVSAERGLLMFLMGPKNCKFMKTNFVLQ